MVTITLTDEENESMGEALQAALEDQKVYLQCGGADDYGDEWKETAARKIDGWLRRAKVARKAGLVGLADDCESFAKMLAESADLVLTESTD